LGAKKRIFWNLDGLLPVKSNDDFCQSERLMLLTQLARGLALSAAGRRRGCRSAPSQAIESPKCQLRRLHLNDLQNQEFATELIGAALKIECPLEVLDFNNLLITRDLEWTKLLVDARATKTGPQISFTQA
jgi:hypothetical protein